MDEATGWLLDVYAEEDGVTLWFLTDDDKRLHLRMDLDSTLLDTIPFSNHKCQVFHTPILSVDCAGS